MITPDDCQYKVIEMSISFEKLESVMQDRNINKNYLRTHGIHAATVDRLKHNMSVNTEIIDRLCKILDCQPGDIMEYVPDDNE